MNRTRLSLYYLCGYLLIGGLGLLLFPAQALALLLSNGHYNDVMTRLAGMVLAGLGLVIYGITKTRSEILYPRTLQVRAFFLACIAVFYAMTKDPFFPILFAIVGLGVALTGSDTASNILFGNLQKITSEQLGLSPILMGAANSSGGVMGKMIDAQSIVVASTATNWFGHEGTILRFVFGHSIALACLVGLLVMLQAYVLTGMIVH